MSFPETSGHVVEVNLSITVAELNSGGVTTCPNELLSDQADTYLTNNLNVTPSLYQHRVYFMPQSVNGCAWSGKGQTACGTACKAWMRSSSATTVAHELGHNLNLMHAATDPNNDGIQDSEYEDYSCIMGAHPLFRSHSGFHRMELGWLDDESTAVYRIPESAAGCESTGFSDTFEIASLYYAPNTLTSGQRSIVLFNRSNILPAAGTPRGPNASTLKGGTYGVTFRGALGYDETMPSTFRSKVIVNYYVSAHADCNVHAFPSPRTPPLRWCVVQVVRCGYCIVMEMVQPPAFTYVSFFAASDDGSVQHHARRQPRCR